MEFTHVYRGWYLWALFLILQTRPVYSQDLKVSMAFMPSVSESKDKGVFAEYIKSIDSHYSNGKMDVEIFPFARSMDNLVNGDYDIHIPLIKNPLCDITTLPYRYMSHKGWDIPFIIYSHKDKKISRELIDEIKDDSLFTLAIATDRAHVNFFDFPVIPTSHIEAALKQVALKRIDAYIFALPPSAYVLKTLDTFYRSQLHSDLYQNFEATIVIKPGIDGDRIDEILSTSHECMIHSGELEKFYQTIGEMNSINDSLKI